MKKSVSIFVLVSILFISCFDKGEKTSMNQPIVPEPTKVVEQVEVKSIDSAGVDIKVEENVVSMVFSEEKESEVETEIQVVPKYKWRISTEDFEDLNLESIDSFTELLDLYTTINLDEINSVILSNLQIDSFDGFERLPNVQSLHLNSCEINDFYGIYFNSSEQYNLMMINKPYIWLSGSTIKSLNGIEGIENLTSLIIMNSTLIDTSSIHFPSQLRLLNLTNTSQFREYLSLLPKDLEVLSLSQTDANENDISILREHGNIKSIYLKDTPLMDEEAEAELVQIKKNMEPIVLKDMYIDIE